ncbi:immunoglobulin kappa light chain-like isoform X2 [Toxotes jaculatrix]|uniref:immunoglobulin kappa light chain-like isoform X2 n=1 Tax=Toxotes jaculatrix TaxID=941984 RepID=UPI001B3ADE0F|nr:immunoglobulin kappa light chain-like isoform X2 [Toxotes jaculatrix]
MTSLKFALYLTGLFLWKIGLASDMKLSTYVRQEGGFISANVGDNVTLRCFYDSDVAATFYWYKQAPGKKPRFMSSFYKHDKLGGTFTGEFKNNPRFSLDAGDGKNHLTITDLRTSDSATYYCISTSSFKFAFAEGATVSVKGSGVNIQALVHQSASETVQPGGSVTLSCTVHTGTCDGEHSVYWIRNSEGSHAGLIYTHGDRNDQCERKPDTQTHTCFYNLPMSNLNLSHAETYYCAVASCGHVLFGNGDLLDVENEMKPLGSSVYFLSGALAFTTITSVLLAFSVCMMHKRNSCQCTGSQARSSAPSTANTEDYKCQDSDNLHYAALKNHKVNRTRRQRDDNLSECVYSEVRQ